MPVTCTNVPKSVARSAMRRRVMYEQRIADASTWRSKFWRLAGWLASEGKRLTPADQTALLDRVTTIAIELNGKARK